MSDVLDPVTRNHIEKAADALQDEFAGTFSRETIARFLTESVDLLGDSKINVFVPVLAHRFARERLKAFGPGGGADHEGAARGPLRLRPERRTEPDGGGSGKSSLGRAVSVRSAGSDPAEVVNALAAEAMAELGVDLADAFPKPLTDEVVRAADVVVTMGCGDACPIYPGKRYEDWEVGDPALASTLEEVTRYSRRHRRAGATAARRARGSRRFADRWRTLRGGPSGPPL